MRPQLWPEDYGVAEDFCGDVLRGSYEVPFNPATPPVILDIGANIGAFSLWASKRWPGCKIYAYEPHPRNYELLIRTITEHALPAIPHRYAVTDRPGVARLSVDENNCGAHSIVFNYGGKQIAVQVNPATVLPVADILKMDTEGCELPILQTLLSVDRLKEFSAVMMETHSPEDRAAIMAMMAGAGFTVTTDRRWHDRRSELCYVRADLAPPKAPEKPLVWISTPIRKLQDKGILSQATYDQMEPGYRDPVMALCSSKDLPWRFDAFFFANNAAVARARNVAVKRFLASDAEFLFFVDYDLRPTVEDYMRILTAMAANPNILVCGGCYTTREHGGHWVMNYADMSGPVQGWALRVLELGTGFKCFRRKAFELVRERNPWIEYENDDSRETEWAFFSMGPVRDEKIWPGKARWLSEDYWLDWLMRDAGITIIWDVSVRLRHYDDGTDKQYPVEFPPMPYAVPEAKEVAVP